MNQKSEIQKNSDKYVQFLRVNNMLTDEHALTVALIKELCESWGECTSATQKSVISKEIRACINSLPQTEAPLQDKTQSFLDELADL